MKAWTGNSWNASAAAQAANEGDYEGDDACNICMSAPEAVELMPCKHRICAACVARLRSGLVLKADKAVTCPFCRADISGYKDLSGSGEVTLSLADANRAASVAVHTAPAREQPPLASGARRPAAGAKQDNRQWVCARCRFSNSVSRPKCAQCGASDVHGVAVTTARVQPSKDIVSHASAETVIQLCNEKYHPGLNQAFQAAGTPSLEMGGIAEEDKDTILKALKNRGQSKLVHVVKVVSDAQRWSEVSLHIFGSYSFQDLMHSTMQLRTAISEMHQQGFVSNEAMLRALGGTPGVDDMFALLVAPLLQDAWGHLNHEKGFFVICRLVNLGGARELTEFVKQMTPHIGQLSWDSKRIAQLTKAVWRLYEMSRVEGAEQQAAREGCAHAAKMYLEERQLINPALRNANSYRTPLQAILGGIPAEPCLQLGRIVAKMAKQLCMLPWGIRVVIFLVQYAQAVDPGGKEVVRELLCLIAQELCRTYADLALNGTEAPYLVRLLMSRLADEGEEDWVGWICCELAVQAGRLALHPPAWGTLMHGFSQPILDDGSVESHFAHIRGQVAGTRSTEEKVWKQRRLAPPQPALPPEKRCLLQPVLLPNEPNAAEQRQHQAMVDQQPQQPSKKGAKAAQQPLKRKESPQQQPPQQAAVVAAAQQQSAPVAISAPAASSVAAGADAAAQAQPTFQFGSFGDSAAADLSRVFIAPGKSPQLPAAASAATSQAPKAPSLVESHVPAVMSAQDQQDSRDAFFDMQMFFPSADGSPRSSDVQRQNSFGAGQSALPSTAAAAAAPAAPSPQPVPPPIAPPAQQPRLQQQQEPAASFAVQQPAPASAPVQQQPAANFTWQQQQQQQQQQLPQGQAAAPDSSMQAQTYGQPMTQSYSVPQQQQQAAYGSFQPAAAETSAAAAPGGQQASYQQQNGVAGQQMQPAQQAAYSHLPPQQQQPAPPPKAALGRRPRPPYRPPAAYQPPNSAPPALNAAGEKAPARPAYTPSIPSRLATGALADLAASRGEVPPPLRTSPSSTSRVAAAPTSSGSLPAAANSQTLHPAAPPPPAAMAQQNGLVAATSPASAAAAVNAPAAWDCPVCTYSHAGREAEFLRCAMCASERPR